MEREYIIITEEKIDDFTSEGPWEIDNETYEFIETYLLSGDGEGHSVIVQRKSDQKFFEFTWLSWSQNYHYHEEWKEVFPKLVTKTIYE